MTDSINVNLKTADGTLLYPYNPDYINRTGDTMTGQLEVDYGDYPHILNKSTTMDLSTTPTDLEVIGITAHDKNGIQVGWLNYEHNTDDSVGASIGCYDASHSTSHWLGVNVASNGTGALSTTSDIRKSITNLSFPSSNYISLTLGASGASYTAPADGWFWIQFSYSDSQHHWMNMTVYHGDIKRQATQIQGPSLNSTVNILQSPPVCRNWDLYIDYNSGITPVYFFFIYANGYNDYE